MKIKQVFDKISENEGHTFIPYDSYFPQTEFFIKDENGNDVKVVSMVMKLEDSIKIDFESGLSITVAKLHAIRKSLGSLVWAKDLVVGDIIENNKTGLETIVSISEAGVIDLYDLGIDTETHLYQDAYGFVHHNTYGVETTCAKILGSEGKKWKHVKGGKISPFGLFSTLFQWRDNKVIVFDDTDSVWGHDDTINMLKSALDTYDIRKITWTSQMTKPVGSWDDNMKKELNAQCDDILNGVDTDNVLGKDIKLPSEFLFTSRVIFVSNLPPNKIDSAIRSRSLFMDINLKRADVINRIKNILDSNPKFAEVPKKERHDIVDALSAGSGEITMRAIEAAIACRSCKEVKGDWKRLASQYAAGS